MTRQSSGRWERDVVEGCHRGAGTSTTGQPGGARARLQVEPAPVDLPGSTPPGAQDGTASSGVDGRGEAPESGPTALLKRCDL